MDLMANHEERLEWNHHFVIFDVIADQHEDFLGGHGAEHHTVTQHQERRVMLSLTE